MMDYQGLAAKLLGGQGSSFQAPQRPYVELRDWLKTEAGAHAARAAIDHLVVSNRLMGQVPVAPHTQIFQDLQNMMDRSQGRPLTAPPSPPMMQAPQAAPPPPPMGAPASQFSQPPPAPPAPPTGAY